MTLPTSSASGPIIDDVKEAELIRINQSGIAADTKPVSKIGFLRPNVIGQLCLSHQRKPDASLGYMVDGFPRVICWVMYAEAFAVIHNNLEAAMRAANITGAQPAR
ncbi:hypothetical protein BBta_3433 [Bradyrhizobium sp. BTAi1]|nr:hypothetical protein [Bradyrhizobium sp. BTAi1]ABQ35527.1 hypothetical protein BBta_3433 [Bradyrhizobium sp. BTAi1]